MTATPLAEVQATVSKVARNMLADAAVVGIVLGPLVALIRKVPREPSPQPAMNGSGSECPRG